MMNGKIEVKADPGMKMYRTYREIAQKSGEQPAGFRRYREFEDGKAIDVYEDPLASRPIRAVNLNRLELRGKWVVDIDEDPETGEACLILEDPMTRAAIHLWLPSHLDRTTLVDFSITPDQPVEQRPNKKGIDYETLINDKVMPEESALRRAGRAAANQLARQATAGMEMLERLEREFFYLQRRIGLTRILPWG